MSRALDASTSTSVSDTITRPIYLLEFGFVSPVRYSTRDTITWDTFIWTSASVEVNYGKNPTITIFNEATTFGQLVLTEGAAGRSIKIYQAYAYDRRNLLGYSEDFASWVNSSTSVTSNAIEAPDGSMTGDLIESTGSNSANRRALVLADNTITASTDFTVSAFIKQADATRVMLSLWDSDSGGHQGYAIVDWTTGAPELDTLVGINQAYRYEDHGNGWFRIIISATTEASLDGINTQVLIYPDRDATNLGVYVWGAQIELGSSVSDYQPVVGAAYVATGTEPVGYTDPMLMFDGEMGEATIGESISIRCRLHPEKKSPRHYAVSPVFNHVPKPGTRIETTRGVFILEG